MASRGDIKQITAWRKHKIKAQRSGNLKEEAATCNQLGELLSKHERHEEAIEEYRQELRLSEALEDVLGGAVASRKVGECCAALGNYSEALSHQYRHLELARSVGNEVEEQRAWATIGRTHIFRHEAKVNQGSDEAGGDDVQKHPGGDALVQAEEAFRESMKVLDQHLEGSLPEKETAEMRARLFLNLGLVYELRGVTEQCAYYLRQSIFIAEQHSLLEDVYRGNLTLGGYHFHCGDVRSAVRRLEAAGDAAQRLGETTMQAESQAALGQVFLSLGDFSAAKRALRAARRLGLPFETDHECVLQHLREALRGQKVESRLAALGDDAHEERLSVCERLGDLCSKVGCNKLAMRYYRQQLSSAELLGRPLPEVAVIHGSLGATALELSQPGDAEKHFQREMELREGTTKQDCHSWLNVAQAREDAQSAWPEVKSAFECAFVCAHHFGKLGLQRHTLRLLAESEELNKRPDAEQENTAQRLANLKEAGSPNREELSSEDEDKSGNASDSDIDLDASDSNSDDHEEYDGALSAKRNVNKWNRRNEKGETVLHRACIEGNEHLVCLLLEQGHPRNPRDYCGWTPIHEACNHGHLEIVRKLLDYGACVNDPGGPLCEGVTPLHDAISAGNQDVAELLLQKGADPLLQNAKGETSLTVLQKWCHEYGAHLDDETRTSANNLAHKLRNAMIKVDPMTKRDLTAAADNIFDMEGVPSSHSRPTCRKTSQGRPTDPIRARVKQSSRGLPAIRPPPASRGPALPASYQHFGKRPLGGNGKSQRRRSTQAKSESRHSEHHPHLFDGPQETFRPSLGNDEATNASSFHSPAQNSLNKDKEVSSISKTTRPALIPAEDYVVDDWLVDDIGDTARAAKRARTDSTSPTPPTRTRPHRTTQQRLPVERTIVGRTHTWDNSSSLSNHLENPSTSFQYTTAAPACAAPSVPPMRIRVKVQENVFLIPVRSSEQEEATVEWLCGQAAERYYRATGLLPDIRLSQDGAQLAPHDRIADVLLSNEEVLAEVINWDLPPLPQRYSKACQCLAVAEHPFILRVFNSLQSTPAGMELSAQINGYGLPGPALVPAIRSLKLQNCLREVLLSGNRLGDGQANELGALLAAVPGLVRLDVAGNTLTSFGLVAIFERVSADRMQTLEELNLSLNPLGETAGPALASLIQHYTALRKLGLQACGLSANTVQSFQAALLGAKNLCFLNLSHNPLGDGGLSSLTSGLRHDQLSHLKLAGITSGARMGQNDPLAVHPLALLCKAGCLLKDLDLSANWLHDGSLTELSRFLVCCHSLQRLDLSANPGVTRMGLEELLTALHSNQIPLHFLNVAGCQIEGPLVSIIDDLKCMSHLSGLRLCSSALATEDRQELVKAWEERGGTMSGLSSKMSRSLILTASKAETV
uniref:tonsoku-like protein isoform X2 n=1 Tax=Myxine glutinosa TaxID=7769 RepID=UPI00358E947D